MKLLFVNDPRRKKHIYWQHQPLDFFFLAASFLLQIYNFT